jgi:hypothetical protein
MKSFLFCLLLSPALAAAQGTLPKPIADIAMPGVKGRIDDFGVDSKRHRLFVAALGNDTLEVFDTGASAVQSRRLRAAGYPACSNTGVFVANGHEPRRHPDASPWCRSGTSRARGRRQRPLRRPRAKSTSNGGARSDTRRGTTARPRGTSPSGHPESFHWKNGRASSSTCRTAGQVVSSTRRVVARWSVPAAANFPMALDEAGRRLFVCTRAPALLLVYDIDTGRIVARHPIGGDSDDLFYSAAHKRVYVVCGEGRIDVLRQDDPDHYALEGTVSTGPRARTGLLVPEEDALYVAAPANGASPARVLAYKLR